MHALRPVLLLLTALLLPRPTASTAALGCDFSALTCRVSQLTESGASSSDSCNKDSTTCNFRGVWTTIGVWANFMSATTATVLLDDGNHTLSGSDPDTAGVRSLPRRRLSRPHRLPPGPTRRAPRILGRLRHRRDGAADLGHRRRGGPRLRRRRADADRRPQPSHHLGHLLQAHPDRVRRAHRQRRRRRRCAPCARRDPHARRYARSLIFSSLSPLRSRPPAPPQTSSSATAPLATAPLAEAGCSARARRPRSW